MVAADPDGDFLLQRTEVNMIQQTVKSPQRRWELAGGHSDEEPTVEALQKMTGRTRCLVLTCHGSEPEPGRTLGALVLGKPGSREELSTSEILAGYLTARVCSCPGGQDQALGWETIRVRYHNPYVQSILQSRNRAGLPYHC